MKWLAGLAVLFPLAAVSPAAVAETNCFTSSSLRESPLHVLQLAPPPKPDAANFQHWPATDFSTQQVPLLLRPREPGVRVWWTQWANRCHRLGRSESPCRERAKGNYLAPRLIADGMEIRPFFTSFERANGCTLLQAKYALGAEQASVDQEASSLGLSMAYDRGTLPSRATDGRLIDICVVPEGRLPPETEGAVLDYEVADGRSAEQTLDFIKQYVELFHRAGKKVIVLPNPLNAPSQKHTNINVTNANAIHRVVDKLGLFLWHGSREGSLAASFKSQLAVIRGPKGDLPIDPARLIVEYELSDATLEDTAEVRKLMAETGIKDVVFWRNRIKPGGTCDAPVNRRITCLLFGNCSDG
jgi:hypothetical protein